MPSPQTSKNFIEQVLQDDGPEYRRPFNSGRVDGGQKAALFPGTMGHSAVAPCTGGICFLSLECLGFFPDSSERLILQFTCHL